MNLPFLTVYYKWLDKLKNDYYEHCANQELYNHLEKYEY